MNRQELIRDVEMAPSYLVDEIRRRPEYAVPAALAIGFVLGLAFRRSSMGESTVGRGEGRATRGWLLVEVNRLLS